MTRKVRIKVTRRRTKVSGPIAERPSSDPTSPEYELSKDVIDALASAGTEILARLETSEKDKKK